MPAPTTTTSGRARIPASLDSQLVFDYADRQRRLAERMDADSVEVIFLAPSADLEYLTGIERQIPNFGEASYQSGWVTGAFFVPGSDPVFVFPRMFAAFDLREQPHGEVVVVNETDDGVAAFERIARGLGRPGTVAIGDRAWAETTLHLARIYGAERMRTGSRLVNELRRVKTTEELTAMRRAIGTVERTMTAVTPLVVPGTTMAELAEAVEHELRAAGSRTPSFATHVFTGLDQPDLDSHTGTGHEPVPEGMAVTVDFGRVGDRYCTGSGRAAYSGDAHHA